MIYADNAATTRVSDIAFEKMLPFLREQYGNSSSQYSIGVNAKRAVEQARVQVASAISAQAKEITFTSSGSEANSWVLRSIAESCKGEAVHIVTSAIEHPSVLNTCRALEKNGIEVTYLPVNSQGRVNIEDVVRAVKSNTKLVSIMYANNEIGTIQPTPEIGAFLKERGILFHTDAVQAVGHIPIDAHNLQVDFLTASAHKFNGAKGTGILFMRSGVNLTPLVFGGEQEQGLRAGTENIAGIVAAGYAIEESVSIMEKVAERLEKIVRATIAGITQTIPTMQIRSDVNNGLPGILNISFDKVSGESLMQLLDLKGICVSTSSACTSNNDKPSHVLLALGLSAQQAKSSIRISYGRYNTDYDAEVIVSAVCEAHNKIVKNRFPRP